MSSYKSAVDNAAVDLPRGYRRRMTVALVKTAKVINTPHGPVVSGELIHAEYIPPTVSGIAEIGYDEIGFFKKFRRGLKKVGRGIGRGIKKGARGGFNVVKFTGKTVVRGPRNAVKWVARNPIKALTFAIPGVAPAYFAHKALSGKGKGGGGLLSNDSYGSQQGGGLLTEEGKDAAADMDAASYPSADEPSGDSDQQGGNESDQPDSSDNDDSDNSEVSGMANEEWVGLDEIAGVGDEWVGEDESSGDDDVGARPRRRVAARPTGPNQALVRQRGYSKKRRQALPFASIGTIAAAASATLTTVPQTLFRGRRLIVPSAIAPSFTIDQILVGNVPQTAAAGSHPAEAFGPTTTGEDNMQMDTCPPGMSIVLTVTNTSGGALQFRATLFGDSVQ